jgi:hypothetical protein
MQLNHKEINTCHFVCQTFFTRVNFFHVKEVMYGKHFW